MAAMLWALLAAPPRLALGSGLCLGVGLWLFWRFLRRWIRGPRTASALLSSFVLSAVLFGLGLVGLTFGIQLSAYAGFSGRTRVAEVQCIAPSPKKLRLFLDPILGNGERGPSEVYDLTGDEWAVGIEVLKFRPFLSVLGLKALFRISRVEGRFTSAEEARQQKPVSVERPSSPTPLRGHRLGDRLLGLLVQGAPGQVISGRPDLRGVFDLFVFRDGAALVRRNQ